MGHAREIGDLGDEILADAFDQPASNGRRLATLPLAWACADFGLYTIDLAVYARPAIHLLGARAAAAVWSALPLLVYALASGAIMLL